MNDDLAYLNKPLRKERTVTFSPEHWAKLEQLAKARGKTPQECLEGFIETCKPGGSGWIHPSKTVVKEDDE